MYADVAEEVKQADIFHPSLVVEYFNRVHEGLRERNTMLSIWFRILKELLDAFYQVHDVVLDFFLCHGVSRSRAAGRVTDYACCAAYLETQSIRRKYACTRERDTDDGNDTVSAQVKVQ